LLEPIFEADFELKSRIPSLSRLHRQSNLILCRIDNLSESARDTSHRSLALLAMVVVFAALCFRLGDLPLMAPDEGRNAEVAREMKEADAWLVPTYNGVTYLDKPALYFKAVALSLAAFGNNETAARIPSAAFGIALLALVFLFCRKVSGTRCGLLAVIIVATMPLFLANARTVIFDIALAFFVCGAVFAGFLAEEAEGKARRNWYLLGAGCAGLATLIKGPVGFIIPALVLLVFNRIQGRSGAWLRILAPLNLVVFFGITLPWFVGLCLAHGDFLQYGLVEESFHRFTTAKHFHRGEPIYFYLFIVAAMFLPWSLLLPEASAAAWKERWVKTSTDRLCIVWCAVVIVFFSISQSKLPGYILSVTVPCGILLARLFDAALTSPVSRMGRVVQRATGAGAILCCLAAVILAAGPLQWPWLIQKLRIPQADADQLAHATMPLLLVLSGFALVGLIACYRRSVLLCFLCLAIFSPVLINTNIGVLRVVFNAKSGRRIADKLTALPPHSEIACLECFPNGLSFYLRRTATLISRDGGELTSNYIISTLNKSGPWPKQIVRLSDFDAWLASRTTPVYLIVGRDARDKLETIATARNATVQSLSPDYWGARLPAPCRN
jgi:4-amino-4-deoxy-L-arabinose transferase-like glycosyltransferase